MNNKVSENVGVGIVTMTAVEFEDAIRAAREFGWDHYAEVISNQFDIVNPYRIITTTPLDQQVARSSSRKMTEGDAVWYIVIEQAHAYLTTEVFSFCGVSRPATTQLSSKLDIAKNLKFCAECFNEYSLHIQKDFLKNI